MMEFAGDKVGGLKRRVTVDGSVHSRGAKVLETLSRRGADLGPELAFSADTLRKSFV